MRLASFQSSFLSTFSLRGGLLRTSLALLFSGALVSNASANEQFASCTAALADKAKQEGVSQQIIDEDRKSVV